MRAGVQLRGRSRKSSQIYNKHTLQHYALKKKIVLFYFGGFLHVFYGDLECLILDKLYIMK